ncbi:MBL fold metallo-hydrolase [Tranquillimonas rosea]|uniref:MBL fold metallo-hydrolase n=1 Tax=Tranquillimonas rosea TaxID=641238 RepID=UPI003BAD50AB
MRLTHLQSSTELVEIGGTRILTDPWLVDGEYYGSWYHYPPLPMAPEDLEYDYIYISHIHPDHMSRRTLERLDRSKPVLIHNFDEKFLKRNIESLGYEVIELDHGAPFELPGGGRIEIWAADNCDPELCAKFIGCAPVESKFKFTQIDSLCVMTDGERVILNTNDCPFDLSRTVVERILDRYGKIDLLLVGYAGAGPFPQCFAFSDDTAKRKAADRKRDQFIAQAIKYIEATDPVAYMPFAGTYVLGGRLADLNDKRGVPPLDDALQRIEAGLGKTGRGFLLNAGVGYDLETGLPDAPYESNDPERMEAFVNATKAAPYDYDADTPQDEDALLAQAKVAHERFVRTAQNIGYDSETRIVLRDGEGFSVSFDATNAPEPIAEDEVETLPAFVEITVDRRLLGRLLKGPRYAHWNNAEIGSHLRYRRVPDTFERGLYYCMSSFCA